VSPDQVLARFAPLRRNRKGWTARCLAHDDRHHSLSLAIGDDGRTLVNCFRGCKPQAIAAAAGLGLRDLFPDGAAPRTPRVRRGSSPLDEARRDILLEAQRQLRRLQPLRDVFAEADLLRASRHQVARARAQATRLGDCDEAWDLLALTAALEREGLGLEVQLEESL